MRRKRTLVVVNYGGGVNSTALLCEAVRRNLNVDLIVFADTGSERPETYAYLDRFDRWLKRRSMPKISRVRWVRQRAPHTGQFISLHQWCEDNDTVPSRAYGFSGCTSKWKQQPADKFIRSHPQVEKEHRRDRPVERWIGYDADEPDRATRMLDKNPNPELWTWRAPLVEWGMGRDECLATIKAARLPSPGKSSCWMCPSLRKFEILRLQQDHPELLDRALRMERQAIRAGNLGTNVRKGLGGRLNWADFLSTGEGVNPPETACGCYDGDDE